MEIYLIIYLVAAIQGFLLCFALFFSIQQNKTSNRYLAGTIYVLSITLLDTYLMNSGYNENWPRIPVGALYSFYLIPPLFYLFVKSRVEKDYKWKPIYGLMLLPGFLEIAIRITDYTYLYVNGDWLLPQSFNYALNKSTEFLPLLWLGIVLFQSWKMLAKIVPDRINDKMQELLKANLGWLKQMLFWGIAIWAINVIIIGLEYDIPLSLSERLITDIYSGMLLVMAAWIFTIGYVAFSKPLIFHQAFDFKHTLSVKEIDTFKAHDDERSLQKLAQLFEEEKIYRQPKLSLKELAESLKLPVKYVSYLINNYHQKNFHDFINSYRLEEVSAKMQDAQFKDYTLLALAIDAGFNSKSTFNLAFKKLKGQTPSEYRKELNSVSTM